MLSPVSLRICWVAAMAPALTEAATQASSFTLPNSPVTESFSPLSSLHLPRTRDKESKLSDISQSFATLSQIGARYSNVKKKLNPDCVNKSDRALLQWTDIKNNLKKKHGQLSSCNLEELCNRQNGAKEILHTPCRLESILPLHGLKDQCPKQTSNQMMNEGPPRIQDTMGLLNANTSLDCELKGKLSDGSQPTDPEEKLFLATAEDTHLPMDLNMAVMDLDDAFLNSGHNNKNNTPVRTDARPSDTPRVDPGVNIAVRNVQLQHRAVQLFNRIRKFQARQLEWHIRGQIKSFVEHQQRNLQEQNKLRSANNFRPQNSEDLLYSEDVKNLSTAALVSLVRRLESSQHDKSSVHADLQDKCKVETNINPEECQAIKHTISKLHSSLRYLEKEIDSDATESSSSDDSGLDEDSPALRNESYSPSSRKRASWRWAVDRAAVASRWIWLQTQVSDLEYKIRQQSDVHKHLRVHKGSVVFQDQTSSRLPGGLEDRLTHGDNSKNSLSACFGTNVVNGFRSSETIGNGYSPADKVGDGRCDPECIRTRPLKMFRKRRLVRTRGLHLSNRKLTRLSSVKCTCNCQRELLPCVICSGRYNSVQTLDPDTMTFAERISLLDSSFHPVLSFKNEAPLGIRYEKILRRCEFSKSAEKQGLLFRKRSFAISLADQARKHTRKLTKNAAQTLLSSARMRQSLGVRHHRYARLSRKGNVYPNSNVVPGRRSGGYVRTCSVSSNGSSKAASPVPSPVPSILGDAADAQDPSSYKSSGGTVQELLRRRRFENAFDINNIIIPHSVACATRVEKLQYKEILTPKWRVLDELGVTVEDIKFEELEDLSEETFIYRHQQCEDEEKKKFRSYVNRPGHGRSRLRSSRLDNRADSSGANTPDPMSPYPADSSSNQEAPYGWYSPVASPPPTPNPAPEECGSSFGGPAAIGRERRRTLSLSKRVSEEDHQLLVEEYFAVPYEPRVFPLTDEEYLDMLKSSSHLEDTFQWEARHLVCEDTDLPCSRPQSPGNSSSVGSVPEEDPNDPEWTVLSGSKNRKPSVVLKLAKR